MGSVGHPPAPFFDVVIIGGGANGAAAAEALAAANYSVLIVDRADFGSGTSSRSSRMLHCGFRSLEGVASRPLWRNLADFRPALAAVRNAREQLRARVDFIAAYPERCKAVTMVMPILKGGVSGLQMDAAAMLLRCLGGRGPPIDYRRVRADRLEGLPFGEWLSRRGDLQGAATFRDYVFEWPERVCIDQIRRAEQLGAAARSYTEACAFAKLPDGGYRVDLRDVETQATESVTTRVVLNLAGPWVDEMLARGPQPSPPLIAPTKGVQIAVRLPERYASQGLVAATDKGAYVCVPSMGLHLIGATNSAFRGAAEDASPTESEIEELIARTNALLPGIALTRARVCYAIAGVRPGTKGSAGRAILDHAADGLPGVISVTGGTLGTSRMTAALLRKMIAGRLGASVRETARDNPQDNGGPSTEQARTISDAAFRRTGEGWSAAFDEVTVIALADRVAVANGWGAARKASELVRFRTELAQAFRRNIASTSTQGEAGDEHAVRAN